MSEQKTYPNILEGKEHVQEIDMTQFPEWMPKEAVNINLESNWLKADQDLQMPQNILSWKGVGLCPLGCIQAITGHKKNGKTMLEVLLMTAVLKSGEDMNGLQYNLQDTKPEPNVLFVDTEQDNSYSLMVQRRVHYLMGWDFRTDNERFRILNLTPEMEAITRWYKTLWAIYTYRPTFVVLDGVRDVIEDINDQAGCTDIIRTIMRIARDMDIAIANSLHYNPGAEKKMRGWLGTELGNRVTDSLECAKHKENGFVKFEVNDVDPRGQDMDTLHFEVANIGDHKFGIPRILTKEELKDMEPEDPKKEECRKLFARVNIPMEGMRYSELKEALLALGVKEHPAETQISKAVSMYGVLYKDSFTGRYYAISKN